VVLTGGDSSHYDLAGEGAVPTISYLLSGVNLNGERSYVVAPPSLHPCRREYQWALAPQIAGPARPTEWPPWEPIRHRGPFLRGDAAPTWAEVVPEGERNEPYIAWRLARDLLARGLGKGKILMELRLHNAARCQPPLLRRGFASLLKALLRILGSGAQGGANQQNPRVTARPARQCPTPLPIGPPLPMDIRLQCPPRPCAWSRATWGGPHPYGQASRQGPPIGGVPSPLAPKAGQGNKQYGRGGSGILLEIIRGFQG
jgi:hypothetical protein